MPLSLILCLFFSIFTKTSITGRFLTPLNVLKFLFWKEKFYKQMNQGTGFVPSRDLGTTQPCKLSPKEEISAELVALSWLSVSQPWWFPVNSVWLLTGYPHIHAHLQIFRFFNLLTLIFQGNNKSRLRIKLFCSKFSLLMYPCRMVHSYTVNFSHQHRQKIL